jgi:hypothetical protein
MPWSIKNLVSMTSRCPSQTSEASATAKYGCIAATRIVWHSTVLDVSHVSDEITFNELMPHMLCTVCDHRGADVTAAWHERG